MMHKIHRHCQNVRRISAFFIVCQMKLLPPTSLQNEVFLAFQCDTKIATRWRSLKKVSTK